MIKFTHSIMVSAPKHSKSRKGTLADKPNYISKWAYWLNTVLTLGQSFQRWPSVYPPFCSMFSHYFCRVVQLGDLAFVSIIHPLVRSTPLTPSSCPDQTLVGATSTGIAALSVSTAFPRAGAGPWYAG